MENSVGNNSTQLQNVNMDGFVTSLDFGERPLVKMGKRAMEFYFAALEYLTNSCGTPEIREYAEAILSQYRAEFLGDDEAAAPPAREGRDGDYAVKKSVSDFLRPWKREHGSTLLCDTAFILLDRAAVEKACDMISKHLNERKRERLEEAVRLLYGDHAITPSFARTETLIKQFRANREFAARRELRIMVTANMSAGKSTLINALIGKPIARMAQEACTANLCFVHNKPFEDGRVHLSASSLNLNATRDDLFNLKKESACRIAAYFRKRGAAPQVRVCLIDTPGDNYSENRGHGKLTQKAIKEEFYDKLIYVLNAESSLGTNDEKKHLKHIYKNVPSEKVVFALNKLDVFKPIDGDSIPESIDRVKADLEKIGFKNPIICPISARFSLLLKLKEFGDALDEDDERDLKEYIRKFNKHNYDLSEYYDKVNGGRADNDESLFQWGVRSGIYGLENILYGGN